LSIIAKKKNDNTKLLTAYQGPKSEPKKALLIMFTHNC